MDGLAEGEYPLKDTLSPSEARRIALAAQGFARPRPAAPIGRGHLRRAVDALGLLQIDSVNVISRAHYLPLFSRLGAYPRDLLDAAAWGRPRALFEAWAHEASLLPLAFHPLLRWRTARAAAGGGIWGRFAPFVGERRREAEALLARIAAEGPLAASDIAEGRASRGWWEWSDAKSALEWLFRAGSLAVATRRSSFERVFDLPERVLPRSILDLPTPSEADAQRALIAHAARALGVATAADLRDYFRLKPEATPRIAELVEDGALRPVRIAGWTQPAFLHADARLPRRTPGQALLAPFDPLIWRRDRAERLFDFRYRIEIYTPAQRRLHGYYVLPFLMDGAIIARVDLKADRQELRLRVQSAHAEPHAPPETAGRLMAELRLMARWLDLQNVTVEPRGDFGPALG